MKLIVDTESNTLTIATQDSTQSHDLYTKEAFEILSHHWLKVGWNQKYSYTFTWLGTPIIQLPEDMLRMQELIFNLQPDLIIETGVAHGGSLIYYASLCRVLGKGRIIGIDCKIHEHNRNNLDNHLLRPYITLLEGDSIGETMHAELKANIKHNEKVLVILDSNHCYEHVSKELELYAGYVTPGSYLVVMDGVMSHLHDVPRGDSTWKLDNPAQAAKDFLKTRSDFVFEQPEWLFNESKLSDNITYCTSGWLKRIR